MRNWKAEKNVEVPGNSTLKQSNGHKINNSKVVFAFNYQLFGALYATFYTYSKLDNCRRGLITDVLWYFYSNFIYWTEGVRSISYNNSLKWVVFFQKIEVYPPPPPSPLRTVKGE